MLSSLLSVLTVLYWHSSALHMTVSYTHLSEKLKEMLAKKKASLSAEELQAVIAETKALKAYQEEESSPEDLAKIPVLKREDLGKDCLLYTSRCV